MGENHSVCVKFVVESLGFSARALILYGIASYSPKGKSV
jgi:hypothetical protein